MAGNTATIDLATLRLQWASHSSMFAICSHWTITKDQLIRLKTVANLPPRHDRRFRHKPPRSAYRDPTTTEIALACLQIQSRWDDRTREERSVIKTRSPTLRFLPMPDGCEHPAEEPPDA